MPDSEEMQPGEIARTLKRLEQAVARVDQRIENLDVVHRSEYLAHRQGDETRMVAVERDVKDLVDDLQTNRRLVTGSLLFPVLLLVIGAVLTGALG